VLYCDRHDHIRRDWRLWDSRLLLRGSVPMTTSGRAADIHLVLCLHLLRAAWLPLCRCSAWLMDAMANGATVAVCLAASYVRTSLVSVGGYYSIRSHIKAVLQLASEMVAHGSFEKDACTRRCLPFSSFVPCFLQATATREGVVLDDNRSSCSSTARTGVQHEAPQGETVFSQGLRRRCRAGRRPARAYSRLALRRDLRRARRC
jgi:hypothetical protein